MDTEDALDAGRRLAAVVDHLGIEKAHIVVGQGSLQAFDLIRLRPGLVASLTFIQTPNVLDEETVKPFADRLLCIAATDPIPAQRRSLETLRGMRGTRIVELPPGYPSVSWADVVHDNARLILEALDELTQASNPAPLALERAEGVVEGVRFRVEGSGPALLLFPLGMAPTQWDTAMPALSRGFTTIRLGGKHIGFVRIQEERASIGTYIQGVRSMFDILRISPADKVLEVGAGSGALARDLASGTFAPEEIVAVDVNEFMLDEARFLAGREALESKIRFEHGEAEALPFDDGAFDVAYAATVFEECDVDKGIAELHRVLKPGGRAGVIVRSADLQRYWNLALPEEVRSKVNRPFAETKVADGCTDASLYQRFAQRFDGVIANPFWYTTMDGIENFVAQTAALLTAEEFEVFTGALAAGKATGSAFAATPFHCVTGVKR